MSKILRVDTDGLAADGRDLAALGHVPKHMDCGAPASDPVSVSMAFAMSAHDEGFVQRLGEAEQVREHGGAIVTASAVMFETADEHGSLMIDRVEVLGTPRPPGAPAPTINLPPQPKTSGTPSVPSVHAQHMDAESFSDAVHSGRGSPVVRDFWVHWLKGSDELQYLGDKTRRIADSIQEHWADSDNNAAPKVRTHGTWLHDASDWGKNLAKSADKIASAFDTVKRDTPTPTELAGAKRALQLAALLGPAAALAAYARYEGLKAKAIEAGAHYQASVQSAVNDVGKAMAAPPLIATRAAIPPELVKGPGTWVSKSRREGPWRDYEEQVTGYPAGMEYEVPRASGAPVAFDGFEPDAGDGGLLVDAKGKGYDWMVGPNGEFKPNIEGVKQLQDELLRQYQASQETGIPVQWRVAEPRVAEAVQALIDDAGYGDRITVVAIPAA